MESPPVRNFDSNLAPLRSAQTTQPLQLMLYIGSIGQKIDRTHSCRKNLFIIGSASLYTEKGQLLQFQVKCLVDLFPPKWNIVILSKNLPSLNPKVIESTPFANFFSI